GPAEQGAPTEARHEFLEPGAIEAVVGLPGIAILDARPMPFREPRLEGEDPLRRALRARHTGEREHVFDVDAILLAHVLEPLFVREVVVAIRHAETALVQ